MGGDGFSIGALRIYNVCPFGNEDGSRIMSNPPTAKEIRLFCDGELSLPEAAAIELKLREHAEAGSHADFERALKTRVATVLSDGSAPPTGLAQRVRETLAGDGPSAGDAEAVGPVGRIVPPQPTQEPAPTSHGAWWKAPLHANSFAVAATLVLVAGAVLFGIFGQDIDSVRRQRAIDVTAVAAAAVAAEHVVAVTRVDGPVQTARYRTPQDAGRELAGYLGEAGCVYDLRDLGYRFVGGDTCEVPQCERGCHLIYRRTGGQPGLISLHVVPQSVGLQTQGTAGLDVLPLPTDKIARDANCQMDVLVWNHGDRCYLLSVCVGRDAEKIALRMQQALLASSP